MNQLEPLPGATIVSTARMPTRFGEFRIVAFRFQDDRREHVVLVRGDVRGGRGVPVRIHSECLTGDGFGSLRCDCRDQLEMALNALGRMDAGVLLYLRQEGRGIGLMNKIRAYELQDSGLDTIEANQALGFRADERDYEAAAQMLRALGVESVRLMSNNPQKIRDLEARGIPVVERIPLVSAPTSHNRSYLETKERRAGHLLGGALLAANA